MITDQFIVGCEVDRSHHYRIKKEPRTSWEALALGIAHHVAMRYNESLRNSSFVAAVEYRLPVTTITTQFRGRGNNYFRGQNRDYYDNRNYQKPNYKQQYQSSVPNARPWYPSFSQNYGYNYQGQRRGRGKVYEKENWSSERRRCFTLECYDRIEIVMFGIHC